MDVLKMTAFTALLAFYSKTVDNAGTKTGFTDLRNLPRSLGKHGRSTPPTQSRISFATFGTSCLDLAQNRQRRLNISIHNEKLK